MVTQAQSDAAFYEMVYYLLHQRAAGNGNRRGSTRHSFRHVQLIAPYDGRRLPEEQDFVPLPLQDLSAGGFSFFAPYPPSTPLVVVALGRAPYKLLSAEVRHTCRKNVPGQLQYLIGCRFRERIGTPAGTPPLMES
jgi:hypothetical protein